MRRKLYTSLGLLAAVTGTAVLITEATKGSCSIVCGWQIPVLVIGVGASLGFIFVAACTIAFEAGHAVFGRRQR
jgi:hypothetical protein